MQSDCPATRPQLRTQSPKAKDQRSKTKILMAEKKKKQAIWNAQIVKRAIVDSFKKLNPRKMMGNPVMFVVEVGSVLTSVLLVRDALRHQGEFGFNLQITLWL